MRRCSMQRPLFWQPLQPHPQQQSHFNGKTFDGRRAAQRKLRNNLISPCYCMDCQILELCKATAALQKSFWINLKRRWRAQTSYKDEGALLIGVPNKHGKENAQLHVHLIYYMQVEVLYRVNVHLQKNRYPKKALLPELFTKQALKSVIPMSNLSNYLRSMRIIGDHRDL